MYIANKRHKPSLSCPPPHLFLFSLFPGADSASLASFREICAVYCRQSAELASEAEEDIKTDNDMSFAKWYAILCSISVFNPSLGIISTVTWKERCSIAQK
jgi:hypothetical protein